METDKPKIRRRKFPTKALSLSFALLILAHIARLPPEIRLLITLGVGITWFWACTRWLGDRFGAFGTVIPFCLLAMAAGIYASAYYVDSPNRRFVQEIEKIPGCYASHDGGLLVGPIHRVYISSDATDDGIEQFTQIEGVETLTSLLIIRAKLRDATVLKLDRLKSLNHLDLVETGVPGDVADQLQLALPKCEIDLR